MLTLENLLAANPCYMEGFVFDARRLSKPRAVNDDRPSDRRLDQFYTDPDIAAHLYRILLDHVDTTHMLMVEPSAGTGSFFRLLPQGSHGFDIDPKCAGVHTADFIAIQMMTRRQVCIIGNPPFGRNSSLAKKFVNHAAIQADFIAVILPRTFKKASVVNGLDRSLHLLCEYDVPDRAFLFRGKPYSVPAIFQIWQRRPEPRPLLLVETEHEDFEFTTPDLGDFGIQRVGARAGQIHHNFDASPGSHYFIRGAVEQIMSQIDFASVASNTAGPPSLAKAEIVALYKHRLAS